MASPLRPATCTVRSDCAVAVSAALSTARANRLSLISPLETRSSSAYIWAKSWRCQAAT
jgi:hypothetical protein